MFYSNEKLRALKVHKRLTPKVLNNKPQDETIKEQPAVKIQKQQPEKNTYKQIQEHVKNCMINFNDEDINKHLNPNMLTPKSS